VGLLKLEKCTSPWSDGTPIVKGSTSSRPQRGARVIGAERLWRARSPTRSWATPAYQITEGQILLDGEDVTEMAADERAQRGLFLASSTHTRFRA